MKSGHLTIFCAGLLLGVFTAPALAAGTASSHGAAAVPAALRPVLYRTLARDGAPAYRLNGGCVTVARRRLTGCFDRSGAHFRARGVHPLVLHLSAWGRGRKVHGVGPARPVIAHNRVRYVHGGVTEWWRVLPMGFEQGFTVARRPAGRGRLTLVLATSGKASRRGSALGWGVLRYGKLVVTDATGTVVPSRLERDGAGVRIVVSDRHARYPLTVDPMVWLEQKVTGSDVEQGGLFGYAAAASGDIAVISEPAATVGGNAHQGAVYVFQDSKGAWSETQKLVSSDGGAGDEFGISVSLSGTTLLVGAVQNAGQGAAYVFTDSGGTWSQAQKLTASDAASGQGFGYAVSVSGTTALVSAPGDNSYQGAAYVFTESGGTWSQVQKLTAGDGVAGDFFGASVAVSGTNALVGEATCQGPNSPQGAAYVFAEAGGTWTQAQKLTASDGGIGDCFGYTSALSGSTALVGALGATEGGVSGEGAAYIFVASGGAWSQVEKLTGDTSIGPEQFGSGVGLSESGTTAVVGAPVAASAAGAVYVFTSTGDKWKLAASDSSPGELLGFAAAISDNTAVATTVPDYGGGAGPAAGYIYGASDLGLAVSVPTTAPAGSTFVSQAIATNSSTYASPAVAVTIAVPAAASVVSATATQGSCSQSSGMVTCDFGPIDGNAGTATADVTLKATGSVGSTVDTRAGVAKATPAVTASGATTVSAAPTPPGGGGGGGFGAYALAVLALFVLGAALVRRTRQA